MNVSCYAARALRRCSCPARRLATVAASSPRNAGSTTTTRVAYFNSYALPSKPTQTPPRNDDIPTTSIAQPEPVPKAYETRKAAEKQTPQQSAPGASSTDTAPQESEAQAQKPKPRPRSKLRARKAAMKLTPAAVEQLRLLLDQPEPKLIKVGVKNRGCSGLAYHLEYVDKAGAFDEAVEQDGVKVLIDSKALFSIIGSEMDFAEDKLNQRFVFKNPNIKEECGCGESFMV